MPKTKQPIRLDELRTGLIDEQTSPIEELTLTREIVTHDHHDHVFRNVKRDAVDWGVEIVEFKTTKSPGRWDTTVIGKGEAWRLMVWTAILDQHI